MKELVTYKDLLEFLQTATEEQLAQPVQGVKSHPVGEYVYPLLPVIAISTVDDLQLRYARSSVDNKRNGNELVLFMDSHPFGKEGACVYELLEDGSTLPVFSAGHTPDQNWTGPAQQIADEKNENISGTMDSKTMLVLENRLRKSDNK